MRTPAIRIPCKVCGFEKNDGIHSPVIDGPRKGQPWGHAFVPVGYPDPPPDPKAGEYEPGDVPAPL